MTPIGVTDAVMHENGISFLRFEYPSSLPEGPQREMAEIAARLMPALEFDGSLFNIEFFVGDDGRPSIVEVNGRMASQFAPLVRAVHGVSTYELQLELACGGRPSCRRRATGVVAASFLLRTLRGRRRPLGARSRRRRRGAARAPTSSCWCASASGCPRTTTTCSPTAWPWSRCQAPTGSRCSSATRRPPTCWSST